ncbi:thioredoxin family protein [Jeotgalibacillus aurantiacus]|uniref:thioredoxin family protein n=1 Tax=Jeotgalibacillus aurantiacus TaxID=2763266 RepID=UPI001D0A7757|nr:thioredoxin family protein [Jeotgalibacillus aurantiacus]
MEQITTNQFYDQMKLMDQPVVLKFSADWCSGCRQIAPVAEAVSEEYSDSVKFYEVNVDQEPELAEQFGVMSLPTFIAFKDGEETGREVAPSASEDTLKAFIKNFKK